MDTHTSHSVNFALRFVMQKYKGPAMPAWAAACNESYPIHDAGDDRLKRAGAC